MCNRADRNRRIARGAGALVGVVPLLIGPTLGAGDEPSPEWEANAAARCEEAETLMRGGKAKEARELSAPLLPSD